MIKSPELKHLERRRLMLPFKMFTLYIAVTLLLFLFGPIDYQDSNNVLVTVFIVSFLLVAYAFYYMGSTASLHCHVLYGGKPLLFPMNTRRILHCVYVYSFFLQLFLVLQNTVVHGVNISGALNSGIVNQMVQSYTYVEGVNTLASWIMSYTAWVKVIALVSGAFYGFKQEKKIYKLYYIGLIALIVFNTVFFVGAQKQLVDLIPYVVVPSFLRYLKVRKKFTKKQILIIVVVFLGMALALGTVIQARRTYYQKEFYATEQVAIGLLNMEHWIFDLLPKSIAFTLVQIINYVSQGYYGLSLCLELPFEWSRFMGSSFKIMNDLSRWFHIPLELMENSYPVRMQEVFGIRAYAYWHTIFPWWASDFTWLGAIIVVSMFLYYWAKSWHELVEYSSIPSLMLFCHLTLFVMYIPCNNQLFQTRESIVTTIVAALIWALFHGRKETYAEPVQNTRCGSD